MSFGIVKVANYMGDRTWSGQLVQVLTDWTAEQFPISVMYRKAAPLGEGAHLRRLGERADSARSDLPDASLSNC